MNDILTTAETADYLRLTISGVRNLVQRREIPHFRYRGATSGPIRFRRTELDAWIAKSHVPATGPMPARRAS